MFVRNLDFVLGLELKRAEDSKVTLSRDLGQEESSLKESLRKVKADKASAKKLKAEAENNSAIADKELQETTDDLESEKNKLSTQESTCTQTQSELSNVLTGLSKFKSAVTSSSVFAQRGTSFFQSNVIASMKRKAVALLQGRGVTSMGRIKSEGATALGIALGGVKNKSDGGLMN